MNKKIILIFLAGLIFTSFPLLAQDGGDIIRGKLISDSGEELISATILEIDKTDRVVGNVQTDMNGDFSMKIKSPQNRLKASYIGFIARIIPIGSERNFKIILQESNQLAEVVVSARRTVSNGLMDIPANEISYAFQRINTKVFEGVQFNSLDDALQGQIAGLDIVSSGTIGQGAAMRIRGISSINANSEPLIVINDIPREDINTTDFEFGTANEQQFADLLSLNPEDIMEVTVLKDAASTALYGSKGANGVILVTTKRGVVGPTRINYNYKFTGTRQPSGIEMLNGPRYTMLMKQAYFNMSQNAADADIPELNYDPNFPLFQYYNQDTDWRAAVIQPGYTNDHSLSISGGGGKAQFRITAGYLNAAGTILGEKWDRWTSSAVLDYNVSSRISFSSELLFTYMDTDMDYKWKDESLLNIAYKKMPNMAIYDERGEYFTAPQEKPVGYDKTIHDDQKNLRNPVALGNLSTNNKKEYMVQPIFRLTYDLLDPEKQILRYKAWVSFRMNNESTHKFLPRELFTENWNNENVNRSEESGSESFGIQSENSLYWQPLKTGETHAFHLVGAFKTYVSNSNSQSAISYGNPSSYISDVSAGAYLHELKSSLGQGRSLNFTGSMHYAYKSKYIAAVTFVREGSTKFGINRKWGNFPGVSLRWNIADEPFMDFSNDWWDVFSIRPSWGIVGNSPRYEYMHFSQYKPESYYLYQSAIRPENIRLTDLRWEKKNGINLGVDLSFLDYSYTVDFNAYHERKSDILFEKAAIPTSVGYPSLAYRNGGIMDNDGWEVNFQALKFLKFGDFSFDFNLNLAQSVNTVIDLDEDLLQQWNEDFNYTNKDAQYLGRIQKGNAYGSIYGFKYKGVYQYNIESYPDQKDGVDAGTTTMPVVRNEKGEVIMDSRGNPLQMYYNFGENGKNYKFQGGDAIYEDVNHDGSIDELDIVYLGNSNPLLNGGFGLTLRWKQLSCRAFFNFRYGYQIINNARRNAESMYNDYNQSAVVHWRWRSEGDMTSIPRAIHGDNNYNWLPSDRFVEDGSFLRLKFLSFNYTVPTSFLQKLSLKQLNLYLTFNNLFCFTKYTGVDPEVPIGGLTERGRTIDNNSTPRTRDFTLGLSVGF
jgi:TonB-linked SusC/RagA family outer membrane protein